MDPEPKHDSIHFVAVASIIAGFLVAAVVAVAIGVQHSFHASHASTLNLPSESEIQSITAQLFASDMLGRSAMAEFIIPPKHVPLILSTLTPAVRPDRDFLTIAEARYGELNIRTKLGRTVVVTLYEGGDSPTTFVIDGVCYVRGGDYKPNMLYGPNLSNGHYLDESSWLFQIIKAINEERIKGSSDLPKLVEELERSHGERPPRVQE
jgi:hypothetical protein